MTETAGQTRARAMLALATCLCVSPVLALEPPAPCQYDETAQVLVPVIDGVDRTGTYQDVFPAPAGAGFVYWPVYGGEGYGRGVERIVLQHCATAQELLVVLPEGDTESHWRHFIDMMDSAAPYTMRQVGEEMAQRGAGARMTENEFGNCACDAIWGEG